MHNKLVIALVLVAIGCAASIGAYIFFHLVEGLSNLAYINIVSLSVFTSLSTILPYFISRSANLYSGGGTEVVVQCFHSGSKQFSTKRALGYYMLSIISIGFGGSAGPEGPMVVYGAVLQRLFQGLSMLMKAMLRSFYWLVLQQVFQPLLRLLQQAFSMPLKSHINVILRHLLFYGLCLRHSLLM
jgi:hypothetical protein